VPVGTVVPTYQEHRIRQCVARAPRRRWLLGHAVDGRWGRAAPIRRVQAAVLPGVDAGPGPGEGIRGQAMAHGVVVDVVEVAAEIVAVADDVVVVSGLPDGAAEVGGRGTLPAGDDG